MYCVRTQKPTRLLPNKLIYLIIDPFLTAGAKGIFLMMPFRALEIFSTYEASKGHDIWEEQAHPEMNSEHKVQFSWS